MKIWEIEKALTETINKIRSKLHETPYDDCEGAILNIVIDPNKRAAIDLKIIRISDDPNNIRVYNN